MLGLSLPFKWHWLLCHQFLWCPWTEFKIAGVGLPRPTFELDSSLWGSPLAPSLFITGLGNSEIKLDTQLWLHAVEKYIFYKVVEV